MSCLNQDNTLIMIIDIQEKLINAVYNKNEIIKKSKIITKAANILNIPIIITEQYPKGLGETIPEIKDNLDIRNSSLHEKFNFNALTDQSLLNELNNSNKQQIMLCGIESHICVSQTAEALLKKGYEVTILKDICSSRTEFENLAGIDLMKQNGAFIKTTEIVIFELLKSAKHLNFKEVQALIKS